MIAAKKIAEVMGLGRRVHSLSDLSAAVAHGLPKAALRAVVTRVIADPRDRNGILYRIVPEATYKRRKDLLKPEESARTERLARVVATAEYVWDDREDAHAFLTASHPELGNRRPVDVALTELGARQVEDLLWKLFHGLAA